jgi:hypothetical protein
MGSPDSETAFALALDMWRYLQCMANPDEESPLWLDQSLDVGRIMP